MIYNAAVGERVKLTPKAKWVGTVESLNGRVIRSWPATCKTGTITRKVIYWKQSPSLWVTPDDPAGVGETRFRPSELERIK